MKTWTWVIVAGVILVLAALYAAFVFQSRQSEGEMEVRDTAYLESIQDFELNDYEGNPVALADYIGHPLVLNSWAVWCPFCLEELPAFATVQQEFGDEVVIIAINRAEPVSRAKEYTDDLGVTDKLIFLQDPMDAFYEAIGGFSMPETVFVNRDGEVAFHKRGPMDILEFRERVQDIVNE